MNRHAGMRLSSQLKSEEFYQIRLRDLMESKKEKLKDLSED